MIAFLALKPPRQGTPRLRYEGAGRITETPDATGALTIGSSHSEQLIEPCEWFLQDDPAPTKGVQVPIPKLRRIV